MAIPILSTDEQQSVPMLLSSFNQGVTNGIIDNTAINGANTYATLLSRIQANAALTTEPTDENQSDNMIVLRSLPFANKLGILTDANLSGLTTVAAVEALYVQSAPGAGLPATYSGANLS